MEIQTFSEEEKEEIIKINKIKTVLFILRTHLFFFGYL